MRGLNEFFRRLRWGRLEERRRRGLVRLHDVLSATPLHGRYWITLGLLLGCVRDGGPIAWDRDADFGFMASDLPLFHAALAALEGQRFRLRRPQVNNDGRITKWALKREGVKYEFFLFERHGEQLRWHFHRRNPPLELVNSAPAHGLRELDLYGRRWLVPDRAEELLTLIYGDWRRPDPAYRYWRHCGATVARAPWMGQRLPAR